MKKSMHWGVSFTNANDKASQFVLFSLNSEKEAKQVAKRMGGKATRYMRIG